MATLELGCSLSGLSAFPRDTWETVACPETSGELWIISEHNSQKVGTRCWAPSYKLQNETGVLEGNPSTHDYLHALCSVLCCLALDCSTLLLWAALLWTGCSNFALLGATLLCSVLLFSVFLCVALLCVILLCSTLCGTTLAMPSPSVCILIAAHSSVSQVLTLAQHHLHSLPEKQHPELRTSQCSHADWTSVC